MKPRLNDQEGVEVAQKQRSPIVGPALLGLAALGVACIWIYVLFAVVAPIFR